MVFCSRLYAKTLHFSTKTRVLKLNYYTTTNRTIIDAVYVICLVFYKHYIYASILSFNKYSCDIEINNSINKCLIRLKLNVHYFFCWILTQIKLPV